MKNEKVKSKNEEMKTKYIKPMAWVFAGMSPCNTLLAGSGVTGNSGGSGNGIGYGGVDTGGGKDPSAKNGLTIKDVWED